MASPVYASCEMNGKLLGQIFEALDGAVAVEVFAFQHVVFRVVGRHPVGERIDVQAGLLRLACRLISRSRLGTRLESRSSSVSLRWKISA